MFAMFAIFKIIGVLLRNQLVLKPAAWPAARAVKRHVQSVGLEPRSVQLWLGLAPPNNLHLLVVFKSDAELEQCRRCNLEATALQLFRERLSRSIYPKPAASQAIVAFHSHEEIMRGGGYYRYFK